MKTIQGLCLLLFLTTVSCTQESFFEGKINYIISGTSQVTTLVEKNGQNVEETAEKKETYLELNVFLRDKEAVIETSLRGMTSALYMDDETDELVSTGKTPEGKNVIRRIKKWDVAKKAEPLELTVTKTGKSEKIRGYLCFEYEVKNIERELGTIWAAPELKLNLEDFPLLEHTPEMPIQLFKPIKGVDGFILAVKSTEGATNVNIDITVTKEKLKDDRFQIPEDATEEPNQEESLKVLQEYQAKMKAAEGDEAKMKELTDEMQEKLKALQE